MENCIENIFDITAIYPFKSSELYSVIPPQAMAGDVSVTSLYKDAALTASVLETLLSATPCFSLTDKVDSDDNRINAEMEDSGTVEDSNETSIAGMTRKVTLTFKVNGPDDVAEQLLSLIERDNCNFIVTAHDTYYYIGAMENTIKRTIKRSWPQASVTLEIKNVSGLQQITM